MNIEILPYIDSNRLQPASANISASGADNTAATQPPTSSADSAQTIGASTEPTASSVISAKVSSGAAFDEILSDAKKALAALAVDAAITQAKQSGINVVSIYSEMARILGIDLTKPAIADFNPDTLNTHAADYAGDLACSDELNAYFDEAAATYGVDVKLLKAVGKTESNFMPDAQSKAGAMGVMQLMPYTADELGGADALDARSNILGGAKLLSRLLKKYDGDVSLAAAAYNAGSGAVDKYNGIPPYTETQNYVTKVLGYYQGSSL